MNRVFQVLALCISLGMLTFLACRAQSTPTSPPANDNANPAAGTPDAGAPAIDAAAAEPEVYFPASKSGGAFLQHQQAPK
ncbi:MAG TPA: hypothetical protein VM261_21205 [Kofleriaceae bacterium]|nr:hypothetical protein [Kofleriaceae bacterium]